MNAVNENMTENIESVATPATAATRPFYWSVRRELWEHRALWIAPLVAGGLILLAFIANAVQMSERLPSLAIDPVGLRGMATGFYGGVSALITITMLVVTWFYCLDSLYAERRDRSILFWKSLPVSDVTTVTSKLFVASAVSPAISFVIVIVTQLIILLIGSAMIVFAGGKPSALWSSTSFLQLSTAFLYSLIALAVWVAPVVAWLIFVSSWVRRSPVLWAVLAPAAICLFERVGFGTSVVQSAIANRTPQGMVSAAFTMPFPQMPDSMPGAGIHLQYNPPVFQAIDAVKFLSTPSMWIGVAIAAGFVALTVWMRRYREPL